jgi:hypothetical protein
MNFGQIGNLTALSTRGFDKSVGAVYHIGAAALARRRGLAHHSQT